MPTLKVFDGASWQTVAGQGSPGQGLPGGGSVGQSLVKASAANFDTTWTTIPAAASRMIVNTTPSGYVNGANNFPGPVNITMPFAGAVLVSMSVSADFQAASQAGLPQFLPSLTNVSGFSATSSPVAVRADLGSFITVPCMGKANAAAGAVVNVGVQFNNSAAPSPAGRVYTWTALVILVPTEM